jgi:hypothetical protein
MEFSKIPLVLSKCKRDFLYIFLCYKHNYSIIAGKADGSENVIRVKAAIQGFERETSFSVITYEGTRKRIAEGGQSDYEIHLQKR